MPITLCENFRALFYAPFYAAHALGFYEREGVEVRLINSPAPGFAMECLRDGTADVIWGGPLRVLLAHEADPDCDLVCFCEVVCRDPFFLIGRRPRPGFRLEELRDCRLGTVSEVPTPWLCLQDDLRRAGVDPGGLDRVADRTMSDNCAALRRGELDAVQLFQPHAEELVRLGLGHVWYAAADRGLTAYTSLNTRRRVLAEKESELLAMVRAISRTLDWVQASDGGTIAEAVGSYFPDVPRPVFAAAIDRYKAHGLYGRDPVLRSEGFERLRAAMLSGGALRRGAAYETCVDPRLAERALAEASGL